MFKISSTPSPMLPPMASDVGIHILVQDISDKQTCSNFNIVSLPDGMQSFRRSTVRIRTVGDEILDGSKAVGVARFKSRVLVDDKTMVIIWTKREVDVRPYSWRGLVCEAQAH
jgi:hypothetical protein